jgi:hypothetical protein
METGIEELISEYSKNWQETLQALPRYQGWVLITSPLADPITQANFHQVVKMLKQRGYKIKRWSTLSGDSDDYLDFAIKKE